MKLIVVVSDRTFLPQSNTINCIEISGRAVTPHSPLSLPTSLKDRSHRAVIKGMKINTGRADIAMAQGIANFRKSSAGRQCNAGEAMTTIMDR